MSWRWLARTAHAPTDTLVTAAPATQRYGAGNRWPWDVVRTEAS